ncbi:MAG: hypothetical protein PHO03_05685 [Candidatus Omnitrophica bacterium]|nr:hypothetical protein [Candidatus Omnitrophota bacterium]
MKRVILTVILIILPVLCLGETLTTPASGYLHSPTGILFPKDLGGFQLAGVTNYEETNPGYGIGLRYSNERAKIDVYLYTLRYSSIPSGAQSLSVKAEFKAAVNAISELEKRGSYLNLEIIVPEETVLIGKHGFLHARFTHFQEGFLNTSHLYLTGYKNYLLKIRITSLLGGEENEKMVADFLKAFSNLLENIPSN